MSLLTKIKRSLSKTYLVTLSEDNALSVTFNEQTPPFAIVMCGVEDDEQDLRMDTAYLSLAVDAPDPFSVADLTLKILHVCKVELSEPFYCDQDGEVFWGQAAYEEYMTPDFSADDDRALMEMPSPSKAMN